MTEAPDQGGGASRSTDPASGSSSATDVSLREFFSQGWTLAAYIAHNEALRTAEARFQDERDRRYAEVSVEREKALAIKEKADESARLLVAENQAYRDEKGNELREQINRERLLYATKDDIENVAEKLEALIGTRAQGVGLSASFVQALILLAVALAGLYLALNH